MRHSIEKLIEIAEDVKVMLNATGFVLYYYEKIAYVEFRVKRSVWSDVFAEIKAPYSVIASENCTLLLRIFKQDEKPNT